MDIKTDTLEIDGITYTLVEGDFFKSEAMARKLLTFADGLVDVKLGEDNQPNFDINVGAIAGNLSNKEYDLLRDFIFDGLRVKDENGGIPFTSQSDRSKHLGAHRSHYSQIIAAGLKFHFLDFLPSGAEFVKNILGQAMNRALVTQK